MCTDGCMLKYSLYQGVPYWHNGDRRSTVKHYSLLLQLPGRVCTLCLIYYVLGRTAKVVVQPSLGCFMYQSICNTLPSSINSIFTRNFDIHSYFTRQALHFHLPLTRTSFAQKTIKYEGPKLWNSLNESLRSSANLLTFKRVYKSILLNVYS